MNIRYGDFLISDDKSRLDIKKIYQLLSQVNWPDRRTEETIQTAIENSLCFGIYKDSLQIGFARCLTDYSVIYWLTDVIIDPEYRGMGLGKLFIKLITEHEKLSHLNGLLATTNAHGFYTLFGFHIDCSKTMRKYPNC